MKNQSTSKETEPKKESSLSSPLLLLFMVAMLVRGAVLFSSLDSFNADPDSYLSLAENWRSYNVFGEHDTPTAFRPPLYPATLNALVSLRVKAERPKIIQNQTHPEKTNEQKIIKRATPKPSGDVAEFFDKNIALSRNASIALLHWILGVVTIVLIWFYARRVGLSPNLALIAGLLVTVDPILLHQSRLVMTETFAAFFASLLLLLTVVVVRKQSSKISSLNYALLGALYGLSTLCRPAFFAFLGLVFANLFLIELVAFIHKIREKKTDVVRNLCGSFVRLAGFCVGVALVVTPWALRNYRELGTPILTTTHGGYTLYLANNPELYAHYQKASVFSLWDPDPFHTRRLKAYDDALLEKNMTKGSKEEELFQNEWNHARAVETIKNNPTTFLYSCAIRIGELWRLIPQNVNQYQEKTSRPLQKKSFLGISEEDLSDFGRYFVAIFYLIEFAFALVGCLFLCKKDRKADDVATEKLSSGNIFESPLIWGFLLILSVQLPHLLYWTNMRMRAPLEVFIPVLTLVWLKNFQKKHIGDKKQTQ